MGFQVSAFLINAQSFQGTVEILEPPRISERSAIGITEYIVVRFGVVSNTFELHQLLRQRFRHRQASHTTPLRLAFCLSLLLPRFEDANCPLVEIDVLPLESHDLAPSHACVGSEEEAGVGDIRFPGSESVRRKQLPHFLSRESTAFVVRSLSKNPDLACWILGDFFSVLGFVENRLQDAHDLVDRRVGESLLNYSVSEIDDVASANLSEFPFGDGIGEDVCF